MNINSLIKQTVHNTELQEVMIKLPGIMAESLSRNDIIASFVYKALSKSEYYLSRCKMMEEKYRLKFSELEKKVEEASEENFEAWDDLMLWEGYELAYLEWIKKYKDLKNCIP